MVAQARVEPAGFPLCLSRKDIWPAIAAKAAAPLSLTDLLAMRTTRSSLQAAGTGTGQRSADYWQAKPPRNAE